MKTYACLLSVIALVSTSSAVIASGVDTSAYQGALFSGDSEKFFDKIHSGGPHFLSVGAGLEQRKRTLDSGVFKQDIEINSLSALIGFDVTKWLTLYATGADADTSGTQLRKNSNFEWAAGGTLRILDYMVLEPWNDIDQYWVGVDVNSFYRNTRIEDNWSKDDLSEIFASLTFSFYSRPEKPGVWDRLGFYVGPAVSLLTMGDFDEDQAFGIVGGLQLNPTPNMAVRLHGQKFDDVGMGLDVTFHF